MNMLLDLFLTYAKIGAMTFGGGYAMLPILKREIVERKKWVTEADIIDCYAIGQCTPGVIAVNAATLIGYQKKGVLGSLCATLGVITPPMLIIMSIATVLQAFSENVYVQHALAGMNVAICAVIALTVFNLMKKTWKDIPSVVIGLSVLGLTLAFGVPTVIVVVCAATVGIVMSTLKNRKKGGDN
ncbi:MAG: chromate transporter [Clostridia bacterium]|nr:chromate transporter [Clostridia bacterium]